MSIASQLSFSTATSVRGGALGSIPYQNATSSTVFVSIGSAGTVLTSNGTTPTWAAASTIASGTASYLSSSDDRVKAPSDDSVGMRFGFTSFANNNTSPYADYLHLRSYSDGTGGNDNLVMFRKDVIGIRVWQQAWGSATAYTTYKDVAFTDSSISGAAGSVNTIARTTNAAHYLTFVDSNNASATAESVYTTSSFTINPATGFVGIGTTSPSHALTVHGTAAAAGTLTALTLRNSSDGGVGMNFTNSVAVPLASINALVTSSGAGTDDGILAFSTAVNGVNTERFRADASGSLILNGATGGAGNQFIMRGGTAASSEGPQIILGYGNNTSNAITGQANNTWNIDVASGLANNNLRIFRQNSAGATVVGAEFTEASGGVQLISVGVGTTSSGVTGEIRATNEITAYYSSDIRLKENIRLIADPITVVNQIRGVYYDWTDEHIKTRGGEDGYFVRKHDIGVIAQEVEAVLPEIVATRDDGTKVVKYEKLVALLIEAVKDQQRQINQISQALENLAIK